MHVPDLRDGNPTDCDSKLYAAFGYPTQSQKGRPSLSCRTTAGRWGIVSVGETDTAHGPRFPRGLAAFTSVQGRNTWGWDGIIRVGTI